MASFGQSRPCRGRTPPTSAAPREAGVCYPPFKHRPNGGRRSYHHAATGGTGPGRQGRDHHGGQPGDRSAGRPGVRPTRRSPGPGRAYGRTGRKTSRHPERDADTDREHGSQRDHRARPIWPATRISPTWSTPPSSGSVASTYSSTMPRPPAARSGPNDFWS